MVALRFIIQSSVADPSMLDERIEAFMEIDRAKVADEAQYAYTRCTLLRATLQPLFGMDLTTAGGSRRAPTHDDA